MGWIAVSGTGAHWVDSDWQAGAADRLLPRGTVMVEATLGGGKRPERLLSIDRVLPWPGSLSLTMVAGQGLALVISQGAQVF
ncbi:unnamed protein product, partial [Laminaria digitata]